MKTPEEIKKALMCRASDEMHTGCRVCPYYDGKVCEGMVARDAIALIEQLEEAVSLMKIQMRGDCGVCKHKHDKRVIEDGQMRCRLSHACYECLSKGGRSQWEYEGLPEVKSHEKPV